MTDDPRQFAIVPLPPPGEGREALLHEAIACGGGAELLRKFFACEATEQSLKHQQAQTAEVANRVADIGMHLMDMTEDLVVRADKQRRLDAKRKADKARRDAEAEVRAEQEEILDYLETHPEPGGASTDDTHHPGGELHSLDPVDKEHFDPETEDDAGGVPLSYGALPESYIKRESSEDPGIGGASHPEPDPEDLGKADPQPAARSPASTSLW
jgi:hypothetical protein